MRKVVVTGFFIALVSCNSNSTTDNKVSPSDTTGVKNPDGVVNSNVISTDSSAWKVDSNTAKKNKGNQH